MAYLEKEGAFRVVVRRRGGPVAEEVLLTRAHQNAGKFDLVSGESRQGILQTSDRGQIGRGVGHWSPGSGRRGARAERAAQCVLPKGPPPGLRLRVPRVPRNNRIEL